MGTGPGAEKADGSDTGTVLSDAISHFVPMVLVMGLGVAKTNVTRCLEGEGRVQQ